MPLTCKLLRGVLSMTFVDSSKARGTSDQVWRWTSQPGNESSSYRQLRKNIVEISEHMEVVDANDQHVGIVEKVEGQRIKLVQKDALDPNDLFLDMSQIDRVDDHKVWLLQKVSAVTTKAFLAPLESTK
jgi:hypothetical protein